VSADWLIGVSKEEVEKKSPEMSEFMLHAFYETLTKLANANTYIRELKAERDAAVECMKGIKEILNSPRIDSIRLCLNNWHKSNGTLE
jgi:hypothetical protein